MKKNKFTQNVFNKPVSDNVFEAVNKNGIDNVLPCFCFKDYKKTDYFTKENSNQKKCNLYNFLESLKSFSEKTWGEIKHNKQFHYHEINDDKTVYNEIKWKNEYITLYQFKLPNDEESRVVGYFDMHNNFNIVIYDFSHKIYKRK